MPGNEVNPNHHDDLNDDHGYDGRDDDDDGQRASHVLGNVITRNQKFPKVKHYYALIFHPKSFKPFKNDAKLLNCNTTILLSNYVGRLFIFFAKI